jgi:uncharacterized membrane protein YdbT with pleckstrin-like domain
VICVEGDTRKKHKGNAMPDDSNKAVFLGLNQTGMIVAIVLFFVCFPLCWLPWVIGSMKGTPQ